MVWYGATPWGERLKRDVVRYGATRRHRAEKNAVLSPDNETEDASNAPKVVNNSLDTVQRAAQMRRGVVWCSVVPEARGECGPEAVQATRAK